MGCIFSRVGGGGGVGVGRGREFYIILTRVSVHSSGPNLSIS